MVRQNQEEASNDNFCFYPTKKSHLSLSKQTNPTKLPNLSEKSDKDSTLKPLISATLIFATLIFANEGKFLKDFCDINFCDCPILKDFATLIFAND